MGGRVIVVLAFLAVFLKVAIVKGDDGATLMLNAEGLRMFVDELPNVPKLYGYKIVNGKVSSASLNIGMYHKKWKFHSDLPPTEVFAYGTSERTASIPGPTIEALHDVSTYVRWENHLPRTHILPWDPTIPTAVPPHGAGVPTVVHLHGGIHEPQSDGHGHAWFTKGFEVTGPRWTKKTYQYHNGQQPGTLWYHDHAMGLTRVNLLAGLIGAYVVRHPQVERPLGLPEGEFERVLVVCDRGFYKNGSIFMNTTGNNPEIHPEWQPEYFGDVIIVNGKAWPYMVVQRRKYRFRIINTSNARFFRFSLSNGLPFIHVASDSVYLDRPVKTKDTLVAPSEIADFVIDFSQSKSDEAILTNDANYPFPSGDPVNDVNSKVMKFIIKGSPVRPDPARIPHTLIKYPAADLSTASRSRYMTMYEYTSPIDEPTHLYINGLSFDDPVTDTPKVGTSEVWYIINLTDDNHPLHIHLGLFRVVEQTKLLDLDGFKDCMDKINDAVKCSVSKHARGSRLAVPVNERGWKNVYKMTPGYVTKIFVKFSYIHNNASYPFDATAEPGYVYHCHILDHEDNVMMRPLKLIS